MLTITNLYKDKTSQTTLGLDAHRCIDCGRRPVVIRDYATKSIMAFCDNDDCEWRPRVRKGWLREPRNIIAVWNDMMVHMALEYLWYLDDRC